VVSVGTRKTLPVRALSW